MTPCDAKLVKTRTDDGLVEFYEGVTVGKHYTVDLDRIFRGVKMLHIKPGSCERIPHAKDIIYVAGENRWLPLECLQLLTH